MLTPPDDLPEAALTSALGRWWGLSVTSAEYRPVGWGSHHWDVSDAAGSRWFVTADDLEKKRLSDGEPLAARFARLRASLAAAAGLRDCGRAFVVAPVLAGDGEPVARVSTRFAAAGSSSTGTKLRSHRPSVISGTLTAAIRPHLTPTPRRPG